MPAMCENMNIPAEVAQLGEHLIYHQNVAGSNPVFGIGLWDHCSQQRREATGKKLKAERSKLLSFNIPTFIRSKLVKTLGNRDATVNRSGMFVQSIFTAAGQLALDILS